MQPSELRIVCTNLECDFTRDRPLPIVAVDEPIYRRLPAFLIATVDKFASLPWVGPTGALLGGADRHDASGFYGAAEPGRGTRLAEPLPPPDLVIQDELHLISGPLGTMAGLYETAIEALCVREIDGRARAAQDRRLDRHRAPGAGSDPGAFRAFAHAGVSAARARPARLLLRANRPARATRLRGSTWASRRRGATPRCSCARPGSRSWAPPSRRYRDAGGHENQENPADPYMTMLGYFNSLRELGGARRILEEQVQNTIKSYGMRKRVGEDRGLFQDRRTFSEVVELTSRVTTDKVAEARRRLEAAVLRAAIGWTARSRRT